MNRREFTAGLACTALAASLPFDLALAQMKAPVEGTDYQELPKRVPTEAPAGKVEVIEFFWYNCPHCFAFEPKLVPWIKRQPADVVVRRVPAGFRDDMVPQQRLYYVLEAMGKVEEMHQKVFNAIHLDRQVLTTGDTIIPWAEKQGLDKARFTELYNSFGVSAKARRATQLQNAYKVEGVPAMGVAGRWTVELNPDPMLRVTDYLVAEARKQK